MRAKNGIKGYKSLKAGRKTHEWASERVRLKRRFLAAGIVTCELRYAGCWFDNGLGFAHAKKRRHLKKGDLSVVILACNPCHDQIEVSANMERTVTAVIAARAVQP